MRAFQKFKEELPNKERFYSSIGFMLLMFEKIFEMKTMKDYHGLYLKWNVLLLADMFEKKNIQK